MPFNKNYSKEGTLYTKHVINVHNVVHKSQAFLSRFHFSKMLIVTGIRNPQRLEKEFLTPSEVPLHSAALPNFVIYLNVNLSTS